MALLKLVVTYFYGLCVARQGILCYYFILAFCRATIPIALVVVFTSQLVVYDVNVEIRIAPAYSGALNGVALNSTTIWAMGFYGVVGIRSA